MKVRVEKLAFAYEDFRLEVGELIFPDARVTSVVGPNGAGKSTFLKCLASVLPAPPRTIFVDGRDLAALRGRERARLVAYVPQEASFTFNYAVLDFILTGRAAFLPTFGAPTSLDVALAEEALCYVGLDGQLRRSFFELSSGERRLVLIARALAQGSDVLLLDEPTSFLDPRHEVETMALCRRLADEKGKTIIVTLHNLEMAVRYSDGMVFMKNGRVVASGPPRQTLSEPLLRSVYDMEMRIVECAGWVFFAK
ncbi:MAG TPA: ABC transporter ATP-binding protein [Terriglobales bacterium]|nr:ABC transporter ATP-binding protein [Terriglobales bacterium]